jgi:hypothetical protein
VQKRNYGEKLFVNKLGIMWVKEWGEKYLEKKNFKNKILKKILI